MLLWEKNAHNRKLSLVEMREILISMIPDLDAAIESPAVESDAE
jgi:hypothetical protein